MNDCCIINITGNGYCGSSAVTDYLRGFDDIAFQNEDIEFTLLYDVDGIYDLKHHIVESPMRFFKSDAAIKRYDKYIKSICSRNSNWRKIYGDLLIELSKEYLDSITQLTWNGWWHYDVLNTKGIKKLYNFSFLPRVNFLLRKLNLQTIQILKKEKMFLSRINQDEFIITTHDYLSKVLDVLNPDNKDFLVLDQALPANDPDLYKDLLPCKTKTISVYRDPRDVYLIVKTIYKGDSWIPYENVDDFIKYYSIIYSGFSKKESSDYLPVRFEDMVYHYQDTAKTICDFIGTDVTKGTNSRFDPSVSINNVQLFKKNQKYKEDIEKIEKELSDWLYDFSDLAYSKGNIF